MNVGLITLLMFATMFFFMVIGCPISFGLIITGLLFGVLLWGPSRLYIAATALYGAATPQTLMAIPLFVLMGNMLAQTGIARQMFKALYYWAGPLRGSLAMGTIAICAVFGAISASSAAATITMGTIAMPSMREHGYSKTLAVGTVAAGGLLGFLIPPSVLAIIYCGAAGGVSIGRIYMGMFVPGIMLAGMYCVYIGTRAYLQSDYAPAIPKTEIPSLKVKIQSLKGVILPALIVILILGGMYTGTFTPTEAAGVGAFGVFIAAFIDRSISWKKTQQGLLDTLRLTSMIIWLIMAVGIFTNVYNALGAPKFINNLVSLLPVHGFWVIVSMQIAIFFLGCIMDDVAVVMLTTPLFVPIVVSLGYDPMWYGVLVMVNMQCAWLTPPYGFNLFYMRVLTDPKDVSMVDIYRSVVPFIGIQVVCLLLVMFVPAIVFWLPNLSH